MVKFDPVVPIVTMVILATLLHIYQLALYFLGWSDKWLDSVAVTLTIVALALFLGVRDEV